MTKGIGDCGKVLSNLIVSEMDTDITALRNNITANGHIMCVSVGPERNQIWTFGTEEAA